jgi:hypothetical protein
MKKRVIKLTENQLNKIVKTVINESYRNLVGPSDDICEIICKRKVAAKGSTGDIVKMIQHLLSVHGYNSKYSGGGMTGDWCYSDWRRCDGIFKGHTEDAVKEFQNSLSSKYGLVVDGIVGYNTWKAMCTTLKYTKSLSKDKFCPECKCEQKWQDDGRQDDTDWQDGGDDFIDPIKIIDRIDCKLLKDCVKKHIIGVTAPDYTGFDLCFRGNKKGSDKDLSCSLCKKTFPTGYINKMPSIGDKYLDKITDQETKALGDWCLKNCDGFKAVY